MKTNNSITIYQILLFVTCLVHIYGCSKDESGPSIPKYFAEIAAGGSHSLALEPDGTLWAWGNNIDGQLGDGNLAYHNRNLPEKIGTGYSKITAGGRHSLALKTDGTLWAWGNNEYGQLGNGTSGYNSNLSTPGWIGSGYAIISAGGNHSLAIKTDGSLWAWGAILYSPSADTIWSEQNLPVKIGDGFSAIAAGSGYSLALKSNGELWAWGTNDHGRLGNGSNNHTFTPFLIGSGYSAMAAGGEHTLALKTDNSLWAWGGNEYGQLGDGTSGYGIEVYAPVLIGYGYTAISAGTFFSAAIKVDGTLWTWGFNSVDQLGTGNTAHDHATPFQIGSDYSMIHAGASHSLALKKDGTLWAWGWNVYGQVGNGPGWTSKTPVQIGGD